VTFGPLKPAGISSPGAEPGRRVESRQKMLFRRSSSLPPSTRTVFPSTVVLPSEKLSDRGARSRVRQAPALDLHAFGVSEGPGRGSKAYTLLKLLFPSHPQCAIERAS
jgi:hypothetical protein